MKNLFIKELRLAASPLSLVFILFAAMTMLPGYPILVGVFFVCYGLFFTFQKGRENNDTLYTALLPVSKRRVVSARYGLVLAVEAAAFALCLGLTLLRMACFSAAAVYRSNAMMNANLIYLAFVLLMFGIFNGVFIPGFYRTAYAIGRPFLAFGILSFLAVAVGETLHHLPGCTWMNAAGPERLAGQAAFLCAGAAIFLLLTAAGWRRAQRSFERIDL